VPAGAKLVLCPLDVVVDPPRLYELMVREGVDAVELVPATATLLFDYAEREGKSFDFMRLVAIGGEAWRNEKYTFFKRLCGPQTRLINSYGLTEATMDSTWFEPPADAELPPGRFVPIGRPFANTRIYVLDANLEPTPIGIPGELCIGGVAVGQGDAQRVIDPGRMLHAERNDAERLARSRARMGKNQLDDAVDLGLRGLDRLEARLDRR